MRKIRIGNDIAVQWSLVAKGTGEPFVVEGKDIRLTLKNIFAKTAINEFDVAGNTISWTFKGAEQKQVGIYSLEVSLLDEQGVMITTDVCDFVELVACSCEIGGVDVTGVHTESIELVSDVDVAAGIDLSAYLTKTEAQTTYQPQEKGKGLSTNDYTTAEKNKLAGLQNYDDTEIRQELTELSDEKEDKTNKVTSLTEESTDEQYPSAKAVYALSERISENEILIEDLQNTKIDKEADDYYPQLAVGLADNLSGVDVVDSEVNFRRSGGGAISDGVARIEAIKGNSVVWNQLVEFSDFSQLSSKWDVQGCDISIANNELVIVARTNTNVLYQQKFFANHSYRIVLEVKSASANPRCRIGLFDGGNFIANEYNQVNNEQFTFIEFLATPSKDCSAIYIRPDSDVSIAQGEAAYIRNFRINDVTKAFPVDTPTTIEEFNARKPLGIDESAYNEGEVIHMDVQSIESQGVNAWDEEVAIGCLNPDGTITLESTRLTTSIFPVIGGKAYFLSTPSTYTIAGRQAFYDKDFNLVRYDGDGAIPNTEFVVPANASYMRYCFAGAYGSTYNHDICINLSDTSINGKYFPYVKRTEDLSIIRKYFPQGMKSAGSAHDEIRYNKATQKWEKVQRIGSVDMGSLSWYTNVGVGNLASTTTWKARMLPLHTNKNGLCKVYPFSKLWVAELNTISFTIAGDNYYIGVTDPSYENVASFKSAMQGVILYYELAKPIVTELDAEDQFKDLDYQVWNCGTEKAIAEGKSAPLAADITYGFNAIGKIKELESLVAALRAKVGI